VAAPLIVITGATHGMGRALAIAFAREGHPLLLIARHAETIPELADRPHRFAEADVTDYPRLQAAIEAAEAQFGPTDCLINDAGFIHIGDFSKRASMISTMRSMFCSRAWCTAAAPSCRA
jgi:Short-chain alcohol dehydrogenase of unknown specificity